jgi:hypothetical protein
MTKPPNTEGVWLLKAPPGGVSLPDERTGSVRVGGRGRIRCPKCGWQPSRHDVWMCVCLHSWNTFDTKGVCPGCGIKWSDTQCLRCKQWSRHDDWYEDEDESK